MKKMEVKLINDIKETEDLKNFRKMIQGKKVKKKKENKNKKIKFVFNKR